jgi:hypothetical protein
MKIISDFLDYYFPYASGDGPTLILNSRGGPSRPEQFALLNSKAINTPPFGKIEDVMGYFWKTENIYIDKVVVYEDEYAHCGEGKRLATTKSLSMELWDDIHAKDYFCSAYLPKNIGVSWRRLQIGPHAFWIEYVSRESWMSNVGDGDCSVIGVDWNSNDNPFPAYPIYAIDYVIGRELYAVDLNIAPGISKSGVEKYLTGREVCDILEKRLLEIQNEI